MPAIKQILIVLSISIALGCDRDGGGLSCEEEIKSELSALSRYYPDVRFGSSSSESNGISSERYMFSYSSFDNEEERTEHFNNLVSLGQSHISPLTEAARNAEVPVRFFAILALGEIRNASATLTLMQNLNEEESNIRGASAWALGLIGNRVAVDALAKKLSDNDNLVQILAAQALGHIGDKKAEGALINLLMNEEEEGTYVPVSATLALGHMKSSLSIAVLVEQLRSDEYFLATSSIKALVLIHAVETVPLVLAIIPDIDENMDYRIEVYLSSFSNIEHYLIRALDCTEERVRATASRALGKYNTPKAIASLVQSSKDDSAGVRQATAEALGSHSETLAIRALTTLLLDSDTKVRIAAARSLSLTKSKDTVDQLLGALKDSEPTVRGYASFALGAIGDMRALEPLFNLMNDKDYQVSAIARKSLIIIGEGAVPFLIQKLKEDGSEITSVVEILGRIGEPATAELVELLNCPVIKFKAALALGIAGDKRAVPILITALMNDYDDLRHMAAVVLGKLEDVARDAVPALISSLGDTNAGVRKGVARALGEIGDARAVIPLTLALRDKEVDVRCRAAWSLKEMGDQTALPALYYALTDENSCVRSFSQKAIVRITEGKTDGRKSKRKRKTRWND